jgi:beta-glucanase (GH16 family)
MKSKLLFICIVTVFFCTSKTMAQGSENPRLADSIENILYSVDSLLEIQDSLDALYGPITITGNYSRCRQVNNFTNYTGSPISLYDFGMPYALVFEDNFDTLNTAFWHVIDKCSTECNTDPKVNDCDNKDRDDAFLQYYQKENVFISKDLKSGNKILTLKIEENPGVRFNNTWPFKKDINYKFTSGFLQSKYSLPFKSCLVEARIKLPRTINMNGLQPAFWLMGGNPDDYDEFDIFEFSDDDNTMKTTAYKHSNSNRCEDKYTNYWPGYFNEWHTYQFYWNNYAMVVYVDNHLVYTKSHYRKRKRNNSDVITLEPNNTYKEMDIYPNNPMRIMFNIMAKMCDKHRSGNTSFPQIMEMDWIRIWYQQPCNKDIVITSKNQIPIEPEVLNFVFGKNVKIETDINIPSNRFVKIGHSEKLEVDATKTITIGNNTLFIMNPEKDRCEFTPPGIAPNTESEFNNLTMGEVIYGDVFIPNPTDGYLYFSKTSNFLKDKIIKYSIFDLYGRKVLNGNTISEKRIDCMNLKQGCYIINYTYDNMINTQKIIVEK